MPILSSRTLSARCFSAEHTNHAPKSMCIAARAAHGAAEQKGRIGDVRGTYDVSCTTLRGDTLRGTMEVTGHPDGTTRYASQYPGVFGPLGYASEMVEHDKHRRVAAKIGPIEVLRGEGATRDAPDAVTRTWEFAAAFGLAFALDAPVLGSALERLGLIRRLTMRATEVRSADGQWAQNDDIVDAQGQTSSLNKLVGLRRRVDGAPIA